MTAVGTLPAVDGPDLRPATRKRARPTVPVVEAGVPEQRRGLPGEVGARLVALESTLRAIDLRLEAFERDVRSSSEQLRAAILEGFQEAASRAVVLSEVADEAATRQSTTLERVESFVARIPAELPPATDLSSVETAIASLAVRVDAIPAEPPAPVDLSGVESAVAGFASKLAPLQKTADAVAELKAVVGALAAAVDRVRPDDLRSQVELVAERLSSLLGGPSLTELMDRQDDIDQRLTAIEEHLRSIRVRAPLRAGDAGQRPAKG